MVLKRSQSQRSTAEKEDFGACPIRNSLSVPATDSAYDIFRTILLRSYLKDEMDKRKVGLGRMKSMSSKGEELRGVAIKEGYVVLNSEDWTINLNDRFMLNYIKQARVFALWDNLNEKEKEMLKEKGSLEELSDFFLKLPEDQRLNFPVLSSQLGMSVTAREIQLLKEHGYVQSDLKSKHDIFQLEFVRKEDSAFRKYLIKKKLERQLSLTDKSSLEIERKFDKLAIASIDRIPEVTTSVNIPERKRKNNSTKPLRLF